MVVHRSSYHSTVTPGQLSVAVAIPGFTVAEHRPGSLPTVMFAGQVMTGFSVSLTVIVKLHVSVAPCESVATH